jgi:tetraacyldisaccharide 4'-kinase
MDRRGTGNGWLLPAGPLREGPWRLAGIDVLVVNGPELPDAAVGVPPQRRFRMTLGGARFLRLGRPAETCLAQELRGRRLYAVAGIGEPQRFFDDLAALGLEFSARAFPDHHRYTAGDLSFSQGGTLLMTEKDGVKCAAFAPEDAWVLRVDARVETDPAAPQSAGLLDLVAEKIDGRTPA